MSKNTPRVLRPMKAAATSSRLLARKIASMSQEGSPRQNTKQLNTTSSAANTYLNQAGGMRTALPASSASTASAWISTPGVVASTGVGLASLSPEAVYPTSATVPSSAGTASPQTGSPSIRSAALA